MVTSPRLAAATRGGYSRKESSICHGTRDRWAYSSAVWPSGAIGMWPSWPLRKLVTTAFLMLKHGEPYRYAKPELLRKKFRKLHYEATGERLPVRRTGRPQGLGETYRAIGLPAVTQASFRPVNKPRSKSAKLAGWVQQIHTNSELAGTKPSSVLWLINGEEPAAAGSSPPTASAAGPPHLLPSLRSGAGPQSTHAIVRSPPLRAGGFLFLTIGPSEARSPFQPRHVAAVFGARYLTAFRGS